MFGFTKDVQAFINFVADTVAPEDWRNPVRKLQCKHPQVTIHPLCHSQIDSLLAVAESLAPTPPLKARNKAMLCVLLDGALRISELMNALKVNLQSDGMFQVHGKGAKEREVALAPSTMAAIQTYLSLRQDASPFLMVTENGSQLTYDGVKSLFHRWRQAAPTAFQGVRLSAHTLRHTFATMRRVAGMSEGDLQTFLGHATSAITRHYSAFALSTQQGSASGGAVGAVGHGVFHPVGRLLSPSAEAVGPLLAFLLRAGGPVGLDPGGRRLRMPHRRWFLPSQGIRRRLLRNAPHSPPELAFQLHNPSFQGLDAAKELADELNQLLPGGRG
jgi:integrase/recombinase XerD